jgi:thymidine kinase
MSADRKKGELEAIFGPMYSGKTGELIDQIERESYADRKGVVFKPSNDTRYSTDGEVVTHGGKKIMGYRISTDTPVVIYQLVKEIEESGEKVDIVGIDEAQFFDKTLLDVVEALVEDGKSVIVAGLAADFRDEPFGPMSTLVIRADKTVHKTAMCTYRYEDGHVCGEDATKTQRLINGEPAGYYDQVVVVGGKTLYEARCGEHHYVNDKPKLNIPNKASE